LRGTDGRPDSGYTIDQHPGLAVVVDGSVVPFSGNGANITRTLLEIAALPNAVGREAVIRDGEILAPDRLGF
jgi:hypothetical protein